MANARKEMIGEHIDGLGIFIGEFSSADLDANKDKDAAKEAEVKYGLHYFNTQFVKKNKKIVGMKLYICTLAELKL